MSVTAREIAKFLGSEVWSHGEREADKLGQLMPGQSGTLSFCKTNKEGSLAAVEMSAASIVIIPDTMTRIVFNNKALIPVRDSKISFVKAANHFFRWRSSNHSFHPKKAIHPDAKIDPSVSVGPYCVIGAGVQIGPNSILEAHVTIFPGCKIGSRVRIKPGVVIGGEGFGHVRDADGRLIQFPHIGSVIIEDDVEIGANTCIDRGALGNTIVQRGTVIDNLVHIAHNDVLGKDCFVVCHTGLGGSVHVGDRSYLGIAATVRNQLKIGAGATLGMGAVVIKNVPDGVTVIGNPAKPMEKK